MIHNTFYSVLFLNDYLVSNFQPSASAALVQTSGLYSINQFQKNCKVCTMMVTNWLVAFFSLLSLVFHFFLIHFLFVYVYYFVSCSMLIHA